MNADEAAAFIEHDEIIATSGFTPAGHPKVIPPAIARRGRQLHEAGEDFGLTLYTGASTGDELDGELARAQLINRRLPYQSCKELREQINAGKVEFSDFHLSNVPYYIQTGFLAPPKTAIVEAVDVTADGKVYLSTSGGASAAYLQAASRIFIEWNQFFGTKLKGLHDIYEPQHGPPRHILPIYTPSDRIGTPYVQVSPDKIAGIVLTDKADSSGSFRQPDENCRAIACHILEFLQHERRRGRLPQGQPMQSGVGNIANAVLSCMADDPHCDPVSLYTEVIQDSVFELIEQDKLEMASTCALAFSPEGQAKFLANIDEWRSKFLIRQQDITNSPEVIHRLGLISMNTALEMDIFGNVNSTHVLGSIMMNGIGGSADFTRNCLLPIFMTQSQSKGGRISNVVPLVSHADHSEHSTQIFVTEQGLADLRGLSPVERARVIIEKCAHPDYKGPLTDILNDGLERAPSKHIPLLLDRAFEFHRNYLSCGDMLGRKTS
jgi:acetyl-CoA hydrolase/succinyl-CoA:acetate CoA-transferase